MVIVLMGVSGSGKTTIGVRLAARIKSQFIDADDFHSPSNKAKMAAGQPLNDADREPWLEELNRVLREAFYAGRSTVMACSALKEAYRDTLRAGMPPGAVHLVFLDVPADILAQRLRGRHHPFMNPGLLGSQLAALEPPSKGAIRVLNDKDPEQVVDCIVETLEHQSN
jgi:gluconokinase